MDNIWKDNVKTVQNQKWVYLLFGEKSDIVSPSLLNLLHFHLVHFLFYAIVMMKCSSTSYMIFL